MRRFSKSISLMLIVSVLFMLTGITLCHPPKYPLHQRYGLATPAAHEVMTTTFTSSLSSATESLIPRRSTCTDIHCIVSSAPYVDPSCNGVNNKALLQNIDNTKWSVICNVDFPGQDIYPFLLTDTFELCLAECNAYNLFNNNSKCYGMVWAPERYYPGGNNCYLKSSLNGPFPATLSLIGATYITSNAITPATPTANANPAATQSHGQSESTSDITTPIVKDVTLLGSSSNDPITQYVKHPFKSVAKIALSPLKPGINTDLITKYPMADDTGCWTTDSFGLSKLSLANMSIKPHLSRDGGKGGTINGTHILIFCDTAAFQGDELVDFVSSSVVTDVDMNGLEGKALSLVDNLGEWQDDVGRLRGFAPMTTGEQAFNKQLSGSGYRYAVWPESSLIPLNRTHALLYPTLVYDEVDMDTQAANFTTLGNSVLVVSIDPQFGPNADRVVPQLFKQGQVTYGSLGGIRAWGVSGIGGDDGSIYLFGQVTNGVMVAKTTPSTYTDVMSYQFWNGNAWSSAMPYANDTAPLLLARPVMDFELIYAPAYKTFMMIYVTPDADNTFYIRTMKPASPNGIIPPYVQGGDINYVETILHGNWSAERVLYRVPTPPIGYIYAGALHAGYFGNDDITAGGHKALLSWTEHTGKDASSPETGYAHQTVIVTFA